MRVVLQANHVESGFFAGADIGDVAFVDDRKRTRWQQSLGLQFFAAEADHHHLAAEVRVQADVAQRADRDLGARRVDRHAAAVAVLEADHVVDVRETRQQLRLDALQRKVEHAGDALHGRRDGQDVARADRTVGIAKTFEGVAIERRLRCGLDGGDRQAVESTRFGHLQQPLVDPAAGGDVVVGKADRDAVAQHRRSRRRCRPAPPCAPAARARAASVPRAAPRRAAGHRRWRRWRRCRARACGWSVARTSVFRERSPVHSGLMPAFLMTLVHRSSSLCTNLV